MCIRDRSSPEILVRLVNGEVTIRPIAGTRPRGKNPKEDKKYNLAQFQFL